MELDRRPWEVASDSLRFGRFDTREEAEEFIAETLEGWNYTPECFRNDVLYLIKREVVATFPFALE